MKSGCLFVVGLLFGCGLAQAATNVHGVSLASLHRGGFAYGSEECCKQLAAIAAVGGNWVAITDYAFMRAVDQPHVRYGFGGRSGEGDIAQVIRDAHAAGLKVLVKPHVWSGDFGRRGGKWHGDIRMTSDADWDQWFKEYGDYLLAQARVAADNGAEAFCVGVEYDGTIDQPARWRKLIADVRKIYSGKITYASSCFSWKKVAWWDAVDCIGIDAYFAVATTSGAGEDKLRAGWENVYADLEPAARALGKQVCFTELGYSASADAGTQPWAYGMNDPDPAYQARLYKVALDEAEKHSDVVVGVFVWKWFSSDQFRRMEGRDPFAMQDREGVLAVLREAWHAPAATQPVAAASASVKSADGSGAK